MPIPFTKMHGLGNDFVVLNGLERDYLLSSQLITQMADRRFGIGFDQLLLLQASTKPDIDFNYRIFNADGSEVGQCGNGARCIARYLYDHGLTTKPQIVLGTRTTLMQAQLLSDGQVNVNMGMPRFSPQDIPFIASELAPTYRLMINEQTIEFSALSVGNPHAVLAVDDVDTAPVASLGAILEQHPAFPEKVNVGFMQVINRQHIKLRVYERGAGETLACGSGACAAVVAGQHLGWLDNKVIVSLRGGDLIITWAGDATPVWMTGPAITVFAGEWLI